MDDEDAKPITVKVRKIITQEAPDFFRDSLEKLEQDLATIRKISEQEQEGKAIEMDASNWEKTAVAIIRKIFGHLKKKLLRNEMRK